ncbi:MAG TPA: hypothetical protein VGN81_09240 [Pseudonocardiaceae bacterium]|jgi:hypothetical protein
MAGVPWSVLDLVTTSSSQTAEPALRNSIGLAQQTEHFDYRRCWSPSTTTMLPHERQLDMLERLAGEVVPVVRREAPTTLWTDGEPYGGRPAFAGRSVPDAAAVIEAANALT